MADSHVVFDETSQLEVDVVCETQNIPREGDEVLPRASLGVGSEAPGVEEEEQVPIVLPIPTNVVRVQRGRNRENWAVERAEVMRFNHYGQAVAPSRTVARFARFLGQQAIDRNLFPIDVLDWRGFRGRVLDRAWTKIEATIDWRDDRTMALSHRIRIVAEAKMNERWKHHKCHLRKVWYKPFRNTHQRFVCGDGHVDPDQWLGLVAHWDTNEGQNRCAVNTINRGRMHCGHTTGSKSHAQVRDEYAQDHNGNEPNRIELFKLTHTRSNGNPVDEAAREIMMDMDRRVAEYEEVPQNPPITAVVYNEIFAAILGPETSGRVKGYGLGVTPRDIEGLVVGRRGVGAELQALRLANEQLMAEAARQAEVQRVEMENNRRVMDQYRAEVERLQIVNNAEILNLQRQQSQMDFNFNGRVSTALDSYFRGSVGSGTANTSYLSPSLLPLPHTSCPTSLPAMSSSFYPYSKARSSSASPMGSQHIVNTPNEADGGGGSAGASRNEREGAHTH